MRQTDLEDFTGSPDSPPPLGGQGKTRRPRAKPAASPISAWDGGAALKLAMQAAGITPPETIHADGKLQRFASHSRRSNRDGWYVLHLDPLPAGTFGCWRLGLTQEWRADVGRELTQEEQRELQERAAAAKRTREEEEARRHAWAAKRALNIWDAASAAPADHPYLTRKGVQAPLLRLYSASEQEEEGELSIGGMPCEGALVVPMKDAGGKLTTLEFISAAGEKRWLPGGAKKGARLVMGDVDGAPLVVCEGYATGASIREATGYPVAVAGDAGNLEPVAVALRKAYPAVRLVIAADNDESGRGQDDANKAAAAAGAVVALPLVQGQDWNDVHQARGLDAVRAAFDAVLTPQAGEPKHQGEGAGSGGADADEARLSELATLEGLAYARQRAQAAKDLGIPVGQLDRLVKERRPKPITDEDAEAMVRTERGLNGAAPEEEKRPPAVTLDDFHAYLPAHTYIFTPTRETWPAVSVNAILPMVTQAGKKKPIKPAKWLDRERPVLQMTWAPGHPMVIRDRLVADGGWIERPGANCFNLYRGPVIAHGDAGEAQPWLDHIAYVYPDEAQHIVRWFAHRVQRPGEKINHALVFGGSQGIGKDTLLEPIKHAVGPWNLQEVSPAQVVGRFNGFIKSVILRVSEARDLGGSDRFAFYDHMKTYTAAPPEVLLCDEKQLREHSVFNVMGVIITTNHKADGIYLPPDDRRHFVAWSERTRADFSEQYWRELYGWYESGGYGHVAAYLATLDISDWNPKAPPPQTAAWHDIVSANRAPENGELADALEALGNPPAVTIGMLAEKACDDFRMWLQDRRNARKVPHRMEEGGYVPVRNESQSDGRWKVSGRNVVIYTRGDLAIRDRHAAAADLQRRAAGDEGAA